MSVLINALRECGEALGRLEGDISATRIKGSINPYERLGKGPKEYRCYNEIVWSALKLVELDYIYIIIDTNNKNSSNTFTFLDVCGGPGGFVQHILTKCSLNSIRCVGVGMSLRMSEADDKQEMSSCDWDINHLHTPPQVAIHHNDNQRQVLEDNDPISTCNFYIEDGPTRSGDLYMEANRNALQKRVNDMSHGNGVDLVTADGGFDLNPIRMERELFPLILAQVAAMLPTLRMGGTFILKIFSCNEPATNELLLFLCAVFELVDICKPVTSRPLSFERYVVCRGYIRPVPEMVKGLCERLGEIVIRLTKQGSEATLDHVHLLHHLDTAMSEQLVDCLSVLHKVHASMGISQLLAFYRLHSALASDSSIYFDDSLHSRMRQLLYERLQEHDGPYHHRLHGNVYSIKVSPSISHGSGIHSKKRKVDKILATKDDMEDFIKSFTEETLDPEEYFLAWRLI